MPSPRWAMTYAPLWVKSAFSFLEGASSPDELVAEARRLGAGALALTDRDGVPGIVRAHVAAREAGLRLVVGSEVTVTGGATIVLLAADRAGYANLCRLVTKGRLRSPKGKSEVTWDEVAAHAAGLLALWHGPGEEALPLLVDAFGDALFALVARHRTAEEVRAEERLRAAAARFALPLAAANEVLYHTPARRDLQDVMTCIRHGVTLSTAGRLTKGNDGHALLAPFAFDRLFADDPAAVRRTAEIAERCAFSMAELSYRYPSETLPDGTTSSERLARLVDEGARRRHPGGVPASVREQIRKELAVIDQLGYPGYFLTMHEIVRFCGERNILCQGRGSAANSAVCWCLGVTAVDPTKIDLLFERFLSVERAEPPDIDLDIEHERREEVIQHVYAKYGRDRAAMVANVIRYRGRSAMRDVGRALGIPETTLDRVAKLLSHCDRADGALLRDAGFDPEAPLNRHLLRLSDEIQGMPRHLSIHPGGFLLGESPVHDLVPVENATMQDRTVIQWDKDDVEALGLFKVDLLGLGALTHLHKCFDIVRATRGADLSLATIPPEDPATYAMIRRADTLGVFQIESRAQMAMLPRLRPRTFYDLVIEVAIVRPGPISGGMVHPYLRRRTGEEETVYPHPSLEPVLRKTLGVPLFQEQVMKLAVVAADYTPGEADQLRRDMAAWRKTGCIDHHRDRLVSRMTAKGIAPEFAERVFQQIRGFGEYGFPECVAGDTRIVDADTGRLVAIEDLARGREVVKRTLCLSPALKVEARRVLAAKASGRKVIHRVRTALGRTIDATAEHPFLTYSGWRKLARLRVGDAVACARSVARSDVCWDHVVSIERIGPAETYDLTVEGHHNFLANDFVVHNSHSASFSLLAYAASWLRCHYPAEFSCALLNSLPMGFYSAATIVDDAKRHGIAVRPVDAVVSGWECTTEDDGPRRAVRIGMKFVKGLREDDFRRVEVARRARPFASVEDFAQRTALDRRALPLLAEAGAFASLGGRSRRGDLWHGLAPPAPTGDGLPLNLAEPAPDFERLDLFDTIGWDYRTMHLSPHGHPLEPLRASLRAQRLPEAREVARLPNGRRVRYAGVVICRQRPATASGVLFMTLEDETGFVNLVVWPRAFEENSVLVRTASFLGVAGTVQSAEGVVHVVAESFFVPDLRVAPAEVASHDFH